MEVSKYIALALVSGFFLLPACSSNDSPASGRLTTNENLDACNGEIIENQFLVKWKSGKITREFAENRDVFEREFLAHQKDEIEFAEYDVRLNVQPYDIIVDGSTGNQFVDNWGLKNIDAQSAWQQGIRGQGVVIAVLDSGVDIIHDKLFNQVAINEGEVPFNGVDDDNNGLVDDYYGYNFFGDNGDVTENSLHGTHVAGIALAEHNLTSVSDNETQGTAPASRLIPIKFINGTQGDIGDAIEGIDYAVKRGAKIINASWGGKSCSLSLQSKVLELAEKDVIFVSAAGNDQLNIDERPSYPASFSAPTLLSVGAITSFNGMASFSNYGLKTVHIFAPGYGIDSTLPDNVHGRQSGTSMSSPFVAGAAALVWSHRPLATAQQVLQAILSSVTVDESYRNSTRGRLNVAKAILEIEKLLP